MICWSNVQVMDAFALVRGLSRKCRQAWDMQIPRRYRRHAQVRARWERAAGIRRDYEL